jgi:hypothetical protein
MFGYLPHMKLRMSSKIACLAKQSLFSELRHISRLHCAYKLRRRPFLRRAVFVSLVEQEIQHRAGNAIK